MLFMNFRITNAKNSKMKFKKNYLNVAYLFTEILIISLSSVLPTSQVFTSGYVNTETILHFFHKITNERGTKTVFTYVHVKWFYGQSERANYLNYFISIN